MPLGFQEVKATKFLDSRHMKVVRLSALRTSHLSPRKYYWHTLEAESTPVPIVWPKDFVDEKFKLLHWESNP